MTFNTSVTVRILTEATVPAEITSAIATLTLTFSAVLGVGLTIGLTLWGLNKLGVFKKNKVA